MSPFLAYFSFNFYCFYQYFQESHWNTTWTCYCNWSYSPSSLCYNKPDIRNVITLNTSLCLMSSDAIVSQVLDELGLTMSDELSSKTIRRFFHTFSSVVFVCPLLNYFVSAPDLPSTGGSLSVAAGKKADAQGAQMDADADLEARLQNLRREWTQQLLDEHTVAEAVNTSILPSLFRFSLWRCNRWITPVFQQMVHLIKVFLFEVFSFIACIIYLVKMKKKHLQGSLSFL